MPVKIPTTLPARATLERENIFIMDEDRATHQDIRPLHVAILNLMPTKDRDGNTIVAIALELRTPSGSHASAYRHP